jgi:ATP-dependent helicase HrpA
VKDDALARLEAQLAECLGADRAQFRRRLKGLRRALRSVDGGAAAPDVPSATPPDSPSAASSAPPGTGASAALDAFARDLARCVARRAQRAASVPPLSFDTPLPVAERREEIADALRASPVVIVAGETGSGKTTLLPKIALAAGRGVDGTIVLTQPRRLAARSVAAWIAKDLGTPLGQTVGFKVRFDDRTSPNSLIRVVTDGVLLAELEQDPLLRRYDTIIVDEAHERSLTIDFLLGYLRRLLPRRPDLRVVIASATLDTERFSAHFGSAPVIAVGGRQHPIEVRYRPPPADDADQPVTEQVLRAVEECVAAGPGDILVFLGGERDIHDAAEALRRAPATQGCDILPLYARLSAADQDRIFASDGPRRVVLATNIAETSVTVPRVRFVVDAGLARIARWSGRSRVLRLPLEPVSRASADQRAGRCGRVGPGVCIRLYAEADYHAREPFTPPEILRTDLAGVILQMKALGLGEVEEFPFLDAPGARHVTEGRETLMELGALDRHGALTPLGRAMSRLPVDPRIARIVLAAADLGCLAEALVVAGALSTQDPRERPAADPAGADLAHLAFRDPESDFGSCLKLWRAWQAQSAELGSSALRRWARTNALSHVRLRDWAELVGQLRRMVEERLGRRVPPLGAESNLGALHRAVLAGFPSQIAQRTEEGEYLLPGGGRFRAFPGSVLARRNAAWVVSADIVDTGRRWGRMLARVQGDWLEALAPHLLQRTRSEPHWVRATGQVAAWERLSYGRLTLVPRRRVAYGPVAPEEARTIFIQAALVEGDCTLDAPFVRHNAALLRRVAAIEAKRRVHGLVVESEALFAFFDARVPPHVHSLPAFERWRREAEARNPTLLFLDERDVIQRTVDADHEARFPDALTAIPGTVGTEEPLPLRYEHAPGSDRDGVTVRVPLHALHALDARRADWLVPGLIAEKIEALLRTLPKRQRLRFFPLREFAIGAAETLPFGEGSLLERLAEHLTNLSGTPIAAADFAPEAIPTHLRLHVEVVDRTGTVLARGRDLRALRAQLAAVARAAHAADLRSAFGDAWFRTGLRAFDVAALPERLEGSLDGRCIVAYPALEDRGDGVDLHLVTDPEAAERATRGGMRRLMAMASREAILHHLEFLPEWEALRAHWAAATGGGDDELRDQLALRAAQGAFLDGRPVVRTPAEFEERLDEGSRELWEALREAAAHAEQVLAPAAAVAEQLRALPPVWADVAADVRARLMALVPRTFLTDPEAPAPADLERFVRGLSVRLRKLGGGGHARDRANQALVVRWEREVARAEATLAAEGGTPDTLRAFRRLLEEYHLSLFAQEVRTAVPVSAQRLERAWRRRDAGPHAET